MDRQFVCQGDFLEDFSKKISVNNKKTSGILLFHQKHRNSLGMMKHSSMRFFNELQFYFDVVVGSHGQLLVLIPYEIMEDSITPVTIHATTRQQLQELSRVIENFLLARINGCGKFDEQVKSDF